MLFTILKMLYQKKDLKTKYIPTTMTKALYLSSPSNEDMFTVLSFFFLSWCLVFGFDLGIFAFPPIFVFFQTNISLESEKTN